MTESEPKPHGLSLGSMNWAAHHTDLQQTTEPFANSIPPAILLPSRNGEPLRLDISSPPHPRGTGRSWPAEGAVSSNSGSGRLPLAAAWTARQLPTPIHWKWTTPSNEVMSCEPIEAIAEGIAQLAVHSCGRAPTAVVVPNDFRQQEQQQVLDACRNHHTDVSLIWLPVAAALHWLRNHRSSLPSPAQTMCHTMQLLVCHCDWGHCQFTLLDLVAWPQRQPTHWVPARKRPTSTDSMPGVGWQTAANLKQADDAEAASIWAQLFTQRPTTHHWPISNSETNLLSHLQGWPTAQSSVSHIERKLAEVLAASSGDLVGAIVVGDWAAQLDLTDLQSTIQNPATVIQLSGVAAESYLATGAAIFRDAQRRDETCYLDTLPRLDLFLERQGEFIWHSLLQGDDNFVPGGEPWLGDKPIEVAVRGGEEKFLLVVWHEEYQGVRELVAELKHAAERRLPGWLTVSATPAQGNAVLTINLEGDQSQVEQKIVANWRRMRLLTDDKGRPMEKQKFLDNQPRAFPELLPRLGSAQKWRLVRSQLLFMSNNKDFTWQSISQASGGAVEHLKDLVAQKDQRERGIDRTAVGSDHAVATHDARLAEFTRACLEYWERERHSTGDDQKLSNVVRTLGYISAHDEAFESWLVESLTVPPLDRSVIVHACGHCLRSPLELNTFFLAVFGLIEGSAVTVNSNSLKAVSQALRYRTNTAQYLADEHALKVFMRCLKVFGQEMRRDRGRTFRFRWSALIVGYLLRRRIYSTDFLPPDGEPAMRAKALFEEAIALHDRGKLRPIGGTVDTKAAIEQLIDYIDKKGVGPLLLGGE